MIRTKSVKGRRELRFGSFADVITDAERLVTSANTRVLGNWPLSQLLGHVTLAINHSIDGINVKAPWFIRMLGPIIKGRILKKMSPGFNLPKKAEAAFFPGGSSSKEALRQLHAAVARLQNERMSACHPVLGRLSHDEWTQLHLRHCELHFSFAVPE